MSTKKIIRGLLISTALLILPFIASRFVDGWNWTGSDYVFAWVLFSFVSLAFSYVLGSGFGYEYKGAIGLAAIGSFLLIWINGAVGIIGDDNPANTMYAGVVLIGLIGSIITRLQSRGMSRVLLAMTIVQLLVPVIAIVVLPPSVVSWAPGVFNVFLLTSVFALIFAGSSFLFWKSAHAQA